MITIEDQVLSLIDQIVQAALAKEHKEVIEPFVQKKVK